MLKEQLLSYIKQAREAGTNDAQIRDELLRTGWTDLDISEAMGQKSEQLPESIVDKPKRKSKLWLKILLVIVGVFVVLTGVVAVRYFIQERAIANLDKNGSAEYKQYVESINNVESINKINEGWPAIEAGMKAKGSSSQDIELAKKDYLNFIGSTILLEVQLESSLSNIEKQAILRKLVQLGIQNKSTLSKDTGCAYTEQELPLQDFFVGATLKFKKPMIYLDWPDGKKKDCSPLLSSTKFLFESASSWDSTIFDKSDMAVHPVDALTTFTVEKRILVKRGGLFGEDHEHYILRDSNGIVSAPAFFHIFDQDYKGETADAGEIGSELYKDGKLVGHVVSDITSSGVWIQGTQVPKEVIDANTLKKATSFPDTISKRTEFMQRVMLAIDDGKMVNFTSKELVDNDLGKDLYTYQNGEIINNFGGKISIKKNGDNVSVIFEKILKGEECYQFYYMNDPEIYGFKESYIDGVLEQYDFTGSENWNPIIELFKQKVCYSGKETVTIEFRGNINDIKQQAGFIKRMNTPKY